MVLILPSSGCINVDIKNIAKQMINIERNSHLFSMEVNSASCDCVKTDIEVNHTNEINESIDFIGLDKKFHIYELPNALYPEYPTEVELLSRIGNIVIYLPGENIANNLIENNIAFIISCECQRIGKAINDVVKDTIYIYTESDSKFYYTGANNISGRHVSIMKQVKISRNIKYQKNSNGGVSVPTDTFGWNVYIIHENMFQLNDYFNYNVCRTTTSKLKSINDVLNVQSKYLYNNQSKIEHENKLKKTKEIINALNYFIVGNNRNLTNSPSAALDAPNTIILDGADLFVNKKIAIKSLDYPKLSEYKFPNFIDIRLYLSKYGTTGAVIEAYQKSMGISPVPEPQDSVNVSLFTTDLSWTPKIDQPGNQPLVYYLQFYPTNITNGMFQNIMDNKLSSNFRDIIEKCKKISKKIKTDEIIFINDPDRRCFITGVPLWDYYYEMQSYCIIKLSPKLSVKIVVCMRMSPYGISCFIKNSQSISMTNTSIFEHYMGARSLFKAVKFNIIIQKTNIKRIDVINEIPNEKYRLLLSTIDKYGSTHFPADTIYVVNPETNDVFIGIDNLDTTDTLLMQLRKYSNAYVFIAKI
jgi:hypothetical protein